MKKRYVVLSAAVFLAVSIAVPALGGRSNPIAETFASATKIAKKAHKRATRANKRVKRANKRVKKVNKNANQALDAAGDAQSSADSKYGNVDHIAAASGSNSNASKTIAAECPSGFEVTGGGYRIDGQATHDVRVIFNTRQPGAWVVVAEEVNPTGDNWKLTATVNCIAP